MTMRFRKMLLVVLLCGLPASVIAAEDEVSAKWDSELATLDRTIFAFGLGWGESTQVREAYPGALEVFAGVSRRPFPRRLMMVDFDCSFAVGTVSTAFPRPQDDRPAPEGLMATASLGVSRKVHGSPTRYWDVGGGLGSVLYFAAEKDYNLGYGTRKGAGPYVRAQYRHKWLGAELRLLWVPTKGETFGHLKESTSEQWILVRFKILL